MPTAPAGSGASLDSTTDRNPSSRRTAPDKITDWRRTGHAEISNGNLNTSTHYGPDCFSRHTVGFDSTVANDGTVEGRGAIRITRHNTRNGAHNDAVGDQTSYTVPHVAARGDVLMGRNTYFFEAGDRSPHSFLEGSFATRHVELTDPPTDLSHNRSGTHHTVVASLSIRSRCHGGFKGQALRHAMGDAALTKRNAAAGGLKVRAYDPKTDLYSSISSSNRDVTIDPAANPIAYVDVTEGHGRRATWSRRRGTVF